MSTIASMSDGRLIAMEREIFARATTAMRAGDEREEYLLEKMRQRLVDEIISRGLAERAVGR